MLIFPNMEACSLAYCADEIHVRGPHESLGKTNCLAHRAWILHVVKFRYT